jgi:histidine triad (HIT) family protein
MSDCIFCKIAAGEIPAELLYRDEEVVAFRDVNPRAPVHVLVIPVEHVPGTRPVDPARAPLLGKLLTVAAGLAEELGIAESGYRLVINQGPDAGQAVFHIHVHLLGGRRMAWPPG